MIGPVTIRSLRGEIASGERLAADVCRDALARIASLDPLLHAFNTVVGERAMARAQEIDRNRGQWHDAPLLGVPVAIKDNICTAGVLTTA